MTPTFVVVLPGLDYMLTRRCVESMILAFRDHLLLVDNTDEGFLASRYASTIGKVRAMHENAGVAPAWNLGAAWMMDRNAEYLILVSQSLRFGDPGGADFLAELDQRRPPVLMHSQFGWKCLAIHRDTLARVGLFDPIFAPAYFEDQDYLYRMGLAGLPSPRENGGELDQINIAAESAGDAVMIRRGVVDIDYGAQHEKYLTKWGGPQGHEQWTHPYNLPDLDWHHVGAAPTQPEGNQLHAQS